MLQNGQMTQLWQTLQQEAALMIEREPLLSHVLTNAILEREDLSASLCGIIATHFGTAALSAGALADRFLRLHREDARLGIAAATDIKAVMERDPATVNPLLPLLYYKGYKALQAHRLAHGFWESGARDLAYWLQSRCAEVFAVDIHPAARIGVGVMIDHATGIVIGETSVIGDNVSMLHSVTLGGTGKTGGDRHPKIGNGVLIGAGAKVLGNISIGGCSRIAAGSVVLTSVPECKTVAGVPARIVGDAGCDSPAARMEHSFNLS